MDNYEDGLSTGAIITFVLMVVIGIIFISSSYEPIAEFVCESHELELIDYELGGTSFSKVECGNKKPELQYDDYKVFTK